MDRDGDELARSLGLHGRVDFTVTSRECRRREASTRSSSAPPSTAPASTPHTPPTSADQLTSDVEGARAAGIQPVLMDRYDALDHPPGVPRPSAPWPDLLRLLQA